MRVDCGVSIATYCACKMNADAGEAVALSDVKQRIFASRALPFSASVHIQ
jgi:hypothetical protein